MAETPRKVGDDNDRRGKKGGRAPAAVAHPVMVLAPARFFKQIAA
jgi:hypothetical protein